MRRSARFALLIGTAVLAACADVTAPSPANRSLCAAGDVVDSTTAPQQLLSCGQQQGSVVCK